MEQSRFKYIFDTLIDFGKFIWKNRHGTPNFLLLTVFTPLISSSLLGLFLKGEYNPDNGLNLQFTFGEIGTINLLIFIILVVAFILALYFVNRGPFDKEFNKLHSDLAIINLRPIKSFADFSALYNRHDVRAYVETHKLLEKQQIIKDPNSGHIRILGLSGTGKTFLIKETFSKIIDTSKVFYCDNINDSHFRFSLDELCKTNSGATLILDNCPNSIFLEIIHNYGHLIRVISLHYDPNDYQICSHYNLLLMEDDNNLNLTASIIEQNAERDIPENDKKLLIHHSGKIPFMALLLTQAYNKTSQIGQIDNNVLISHLLDIKGSNPEEQRIAMRTLSLCQPLDYNNGTSDIAKYLINSKRFTPIINTSIDKEILFNDVVKELGNRTLIEKDSTYINVRPQPLAIWLVGEWIKEQGQNLKYTIEELAGQPEYLRKQILETWARRLEFMQGNSDAEELYADLMNIESGPFASEDMVCSDFGSRLILAMSTVNPVATSDCLFHILYNKSIDWLKQHLTNEARRHVVRALEKLCFHRKSYNKASKLLGRLAIAENESWANNAKGQFLQLFHIYLAGTEVSLTDRLNTLVSLFDEDKTYRHLVIDAIRGAFHYEDIHRMLGAEKFGFIKLKDYTPTSLEINEYWNSLCDCLTKWIKEDCSLITPISNTVTSLTRALLKTKHAYLLDKLIVEIAPTLNYDWPEMHKSLRWAIHYKWCTKEDEASILKWIKGLTPKDIIEQIRGDLEEIQLKGENIGDYKHYEEVVKPHVDKFIERNEHLGPNLIKLCLERDAHNLMWPFTPLLAKAIPTEDIKNVSQLILNEIYKHDTTITSPFVVNLYTALPNSEAVNTFTNQLYQKRYLNIALPIWANNLKFGLSKLDFIIEEYNKQNITQEVLTNQYLRHITICSPNDIVQILQTIGAGIEGESSTLIQYSFLSNYWYYEELFNNDTILNMYKEVLLRYPIERSEYNNYDYARQVIRVLEKTTDADFALKIHNKAIDYLSKDLSHSEIRDIFPILLTKYRNTIWDSFSKALVDLDNRPCIFWNLRYEIGAGFDFNEKSLFLGHNDDMKELCKKYPQNGPIVCANLCPIFETPNLSQTDTFHPFLIWMIKEYGNSTRILNELHSNMNTYSWTGSTIPLLETQRRCFNHLMTIKDISENARLWIKDCLVHLEEELQKEMKYEAYQKLAYEHE